ncbi:MAG: S-methyl-5'-thioadenosine phosphorylase [Cyanobacteria bacterium HKST-UBA06]|nr:S-methyl-5'-thioadenosine phosphorylase [Cyanobacteria bacterium HKST-UBA04]MCA9806778.1 S-methyl-5'-thioadenosine phosphorylase [Cyanobacteria bacterium HKST-UBA06]MCA9841948.1 S-methyl-5'-thioadenosine phosphorylase [Cyanobacteria bacterium HKST-UBA03]
MSTIHADIGVFGGSGFYDFIENAQTVQVETPYGLTSSDITVGNIAGKQVAFLPRHGLRHTIPPHKINFRANVWAFKKLGVSKVIAPCAVGSLKQEVKPGQFVFCDQYVNRTYRRVDTFFDGPVIRHVSAADPYDEQLRQLAIESARQTGVEYHPTGTVVVIEGPRFSTRAESDWYRQAGWDVINMTQYPEVHLVKELDMSAVNISLVTDYDTGVPGIEPVSHEEVLKVMAENNDKLRTLLFTLIEKIPVDSFATTAAAVATH